MDRLKRTLKLSALLLMTPLAWADITLQLGFNDFPPYAIEGGHAIRPHAKAGCSYSSHTGYGIDPDFLIAVVKDAGFEVDLRFHPYARLQNLLLTGAVDATAGFFYNEVDGKPKYRYILYDIGGATLFYLKEGRAASFTSLEQLHDLTFAIVRGETFHNPELDDAIYEHKTLEPEVLANHYQQLFHMLAAGRVDVIAVNNVVGAYVMEEEGLTGLKASPLRLPYGKDPIKDGIYIAMQNSIPDRVFERIKESSRKLLDQGVFRCIQLKYGVSGNE